MKTIQFFLILFTFAVLNGCQSTWELAGFTDTEGERWEKSGFSQEDAKFWGKELNMEPETALGWKEAGYTLNEVYEWELAYLPYKINPTDLNQWREAKIEPFEIKVYLQADVKPSDIAGWVKLNISIIELKEWQKLGIPEASKIEEWRKAEFTVKEVKEWLTIGVTQPVEAKKWKDAGFTLLEVNDWRKVGFNTPTAANRNKEFLTANRGYKDLKFGMYEFQFINTKVMNEGVSISGQEPVIEIQIYQSKKTVGQIILVFPYSQDFLEKLKIAFSTKYNVLDTPSESDMKKYNESRLTPEITLELLRNSRDRKYIEGYEKTLFNKLYWEYDNARAAIIIGTTFDEQQHILLMYRDDAFAKKRILELFPPDENRRPSINTKDI